MPFGRAENENCHSYLERARDDLGAEAFDGAYERGALASDEAAFERASPPPDADGARSSTTWTR